LPAARRNNDAADHCPQRKPREDQHLPGGQHGDNRLGGWYGYRASKAALNMFMGHTVLIAAAAITVVTWTTAAAKPEIFLVGEHRE